MEQVQANPYAVPNAPVSDVFINEGTGEINIFTAKGRLGRLRYFYYAMLMGLVGMVGLVLAMMLLSVSPVLGGVAIAVIYIAMIVWSFFLLIQRCHDLDKSGWLSLLAFVPFAIFYFYFAPGTQGTNQFGAEPPANSKGVIAGSILLPVGMFVAMGIISAIAIPAYSDFQQRANAVEASSK